MVTNGVTFQPIREIYPTPSQLPRYTLTNPITTNVSTVAWPLAFRQDYSLMTPGRGMDIDQYWIYTLDNYCYVNGMMIAKYLSSINSAGRPVFWPVLPGSSDEGFAGKYSARQIDSIAAQICNLGARAISPDRPFVSGSMSWYLETKTDRSSAPVIFPGFTSGQWVSGMGRSPKVARLLLGFTTYASSGILGETNYIPPKVSLNAWLEWWLPAAFRGGSTLVPGTGSQITVGHGYNNSLNCADGLPSYELSSGSAHPRIPAVLPRQDGSLTSYWSDQLLRNDKGVDWRGNPWDHEDSEGYTIAQQFHHPYAYDSTNNRYLGTGPFPGLLPNSPFQMVDLKSPTGEWYPGQIRTVGNTYGSVRLPMQTNATSLAVSGGIAVRAQMRYGQFSDPDPAPLEAVRGIYQKPDGTTSSMSMWTWERYMDSAKTPGNLSETVRDRAVKSVIPVNLEIPVPPHGSSSTETRYVLSEVADPLVNKFPGDWHTRTNVGNPPPSAMELGPPGIFFAYEETPSWRSFLTDPDSYWMPQIDSLYFGDTAAVQAPAIPRSARFPNIGYLQYLRTGIIPDDETVDYSVQRGTPFRLLSFAPSTEPKNVFDHLVGQQTTRTGSKSYPDWAILDLLYVPSTLAPYGGPYGNATNLAYFGTYGGATAGRINPNGSVVYTTNVNSPRPGISRTLPLRALISGLKVNQATSGVGTNVTLSGGTDVDAADISGAIETYIRGNGPLHIPGEICNVSSIAALRPIVNMSRNDLVRQIVGNLTTQGNVFSVWAIGQTTLKSQKNTGYEKFETGDTVLAEVRLRFIVERYVDPGADGLYGNANSSGADGLVGTYDDPVDSSNHPSQPRYLYRVVASEEIR